MQCLALVLLVCGAVLLSGEAQHMHKEGAENKFWEGVVPLLTASMLSGAQDTKTFENKPHVCVPCLKQIETITCVCCLKPTLKILRPFFCCLALGHELGGCARMCHVTRYLEGAGLGGALSQKALIDRNSFLFSLELGVWTAGILVVLLVFAPPVMPFSHSYNLFFCTLSASVALLMYGSSIIWFLSSSNGHVHVVRVHTLELTPANSPLSTSQLSHPHIFARM